MEHTTEQLSGVQVIRERHSVRQYQKGVTIPEAELNELFELAGLAPSSWNLQHWRYLVVQDQANKEKLLPLSFGQQQVVDASVVVIVLGDLQANLVAEEVFAGAPAEIKERMVQQINGAYASNPQVARDEAIRNASLGAMQLMLAAKAKGYDSVPMGGFDPAGVVKEFGIPERYIPVMLLPIGKAQTPGRATERFPLDKIVIRERF
ncbi:nitroreductase family protein [Paenibacillus sp. GD4]|jgi:nitroreductase|uniref:nitroreductase family protein n=1 Tax=Paenibacillus sp. GD4 TaxID=3068890 RepID=UPI002796BE23|nr:nitroreductase family protein [Paenibacillus sp. GD4]MDQ1911481.1 nitroreductase family protein [Paenibacillus sp. GD4]